MTEIASFALTCPSFPTQAEGRTADDRPWYFRARYGTWTLDVGEPGWPTSLLEWPDADRQVTAGDDPTHGMMETDDVRALVADALRTLP